MPLPRNSRFFRIALLASAYYATAKLGLSLALVHPSATAVWPPSGIALAAVLIWGYDVWPGIFLGAFLVNLWPSLPGAEFALKAAVASGIGAGNTLEAVLGAWLARRFAGAERALESGQDFLKFAVLAGFLGAAASPTVGVTSLCSFGLAHWNRYGPIWLTWWLGDMSGILIFTPWLLAWGREEYAQSDSAGAVEAALLSVCLLLAVHAAFGDWFSSLSPRNSLEYFVIPPLMWAALRFGRRGATFALLLVSIAATMYTLLGLGPFAGKESRSLTLLQMSLGIISVTIVALAASMDARKRAEESALLARDLAEANRSLRADISRGRQDQERIRESQEELRQYIDHMSTMSAKLAPDGTPILFNRLAQQGSGLSHEELMRANFMEGPWWSFDKEVQDRVKVAFAKAVGGEMVCYEEKVFVFRKVIPISFSLAPVKDGTGKVIYIIAEGRDITPLKQAEEALRLKEMELLRSQKMEAVGRLAGGIAHEFNNILTGIMGLAQLICAELEEANASRGDASKIVEASRNAADLVRRLLAFSRQREARKTPLDLNELVFSNLKMLKAVLGERVEIRTSLDPELPAIRAAGGHMEQLLMNLCLNSRDAMAGSGTITISTRVERYKQPKILPYGTLPVGPYVVLEVVDTGCGIAEEDQPRVFEPFFTTKGLGQGTGLGLSVVYGIVQDHEGGIDLRSKKGNTMFSIYLPVAKEASLQEAPKPAGNGVHGGKETLLVADDDRIVRDLLVRTFQPLGYALLVARDGEEAIRIYEENRGEIAMVMLDIVMPKLKGDEVYARISAERPEVKVLFMSGYATEQVEQAILAQNRPFIAKPFMLDEIALRVREILDS